MTFQSQTIHESRATSYKDEPAVRALFFKCNPLPYRSIFRRTFWLDKPTLDEVQGTHPAKAETPNAPHLGAPFEGQAGSD